MGYTTQFTGVLTFKIELGARALAKLSKVLGEDIRELNDEMQEIFIKAGFDHYHLDLELTKDYDGLKWNEAEKTYGMVGAINGIIAYMKPEFPDFALEGMMNAQGEEAMDIWQVVMKDNVEQYFAESNWESIRESTTRRLANYGGLWGHRHAFANPDTSGDTDTGEEQHVNADVPPLQYGYLDFDPLKDGSYSLETRGAASLDLDISADVAGNAVVRVMPLEMVPVPGAAPTP